MVQYHSPPTPAQRPLISQNSGLLLRLLAFTVVFAPANIESRVIAPPWANSTLNPCAARSWQLLHWPADGRCYQIFERGPCQHSMELVWRHSKITDTGLGEAVCECAAGHVRHAVSGRCHRRHGHKPCDPLHYLDDTGVCQPHAPCPSGHLFWPPDASCHRPLSLGPCLAGELVSSSRHLTAECRCTRDGHMKDNYYPPMDGCYELNTQGPCPRGLIYSTAITGGPGCKCAPSMSKHYDRVSRQCFEPGTRGPCPVGNIFHMNADNSTDNQVPLTRCECQPYTIQWPITGACYKPYTRAICEHGQFLAPVLSAASPQFAAGENNQRYYGVCVTSPCRQGELYFPEDQHCHRVGTRGPCTVGHLVQYDTKRGSASGGVSYRGHCGCTKDYTQNYWPPHDACYQLFTRGPCAPGHRFVYDRAKQRPVCECNTASGLIAVSSTTNTNTKTNICRAPCTVNDKTIKDNNGDYDLINQPYRTHTACVCRSPLMYFHKTLGKCIAAQLSPQRRSHLTSFTNYLTLPYYGHTLRSGDQQRANLLKVLL